ncbi:MAG TPA: hypothetical protein VHS03_07560 [Gaiellaceae bacterium]|nr:hypothetical protein [Gaiellaceae bacterium]
MALTHDLRRIADVAVAYAGPDEELSAVIPTEAVGGERVYVCAYTAGERKSWLALEAGGAPVHDRRVLRDAVSIAGMVELAEEAAAAIGGTEQVVGDEIRVASPQYLDEIGVATRRREAALGDQGVSPFTEAMKQAGLTIDGLAADIESHYKLELE